MLLVLTKNNVEGFHAWGNAVKEVEFLRDRHRHIFNIYCQFEVNHEDRQIEIFMQEREIEKYLHNKYGKPCEFGNMSCEAIAQEILCKFNAHEVKVLEDEGGGAIVRREY